MLTATVHDINLHHLSQQKTLVVLWFFPIINDIKSETLQGIKTYGNLENFPVSFIRSRPFYNFAPQKMLPSLKKQ